MAAKASSKMILFLPVITKQARTSDTEGRRSRRFVANRRPQVLWNMDPGGQQNDGKSIGCRWVFDLECDEYGLVQRFKGKLTAGRFSLPYEIDYNGYYTILAPYWPLQP